MTAAERAELDRLLFAIERFAHTISLAELHDFANILTILVGEIDLAVGKARRSLAEIPVEESGRPPRSGGTT